MELTFPIRISSSIRAWYIGTMQWTARTTADSVRVKRYLKTNRIVHCTPTFSSIHPVQPSHDGIAHAQGNYTHRYDIIILLLLWLSVKSSTTDPIKRQLLVTTHVYMLHIFQDHRSLYYCSHITILFPRCMFGHSYTLVKFIVMLKL